MFWDRVAFVYDIFANVINRKTNKKLCAVVKNALSSNDDVLECACGTGLLSMAIAEKCNSLVATDFSVNMLKQAQRKMKKYSNAKLEQADITVLPYANNTFDAVVAGNVIHLLDEPYKALNELNRVCKNGGKIIIPTYMNKAKGGKTDSVSKAIGKVGVDFKTKFCKDSYIEFFKKAGYSNVSCVVCDGKIPCAVAVIQL